MAARIQLSLYLPPAEASALEEARRLLDPIQAGLIPAHITLCREDELQGFDPAALAARAGAPSLPLTLRFGAPEVFQGHGVLLPCIEGEPEFHVLRCQVLGFVMGFVLGSLLVSREIRRHAPHLTLAHPRNPRAAQNTPANLAVVPVGLRIRFAEIRLIRQEGQAPWEVRAVHPQKSDDTNQ